MTKQPGGFMSDKPTTTADFINEQIASNEEIQQLKREVKKLKKAVAAIIWKRPGHKQPVVE